MLKMVKTDFDVLHVAGPSGCGELIMNLDSVDSVPVTPRISLIHERCFTRFLDNFENTGTVAAGIIGFLLFLENFTIKSLTYLLLFAWL